MKQFRIIYSDKDLGKPGERYTTNKAYPMYVAKEVAEALAEMACYDLEFIEEQALEGAEDAPKSQETTYYLSTRHDGVWTHRLQSSDSKSLHTIGQEWVRLKTAEEYQLTAFRSGL